MAELPVIESLIARAIWEAMEAAQDRDERTYLGASVLGDACERKLWMAFRWAHEPEWFDGRKLSIFETGHVWEARLMDLLRDAGVHVDSVDPDTGEQFLVRFAGGHAGGHLDGEVQGIPEAPATIHVVEAKTHNDKSFQGLKRQGVKTAKPEHYAQMQIYMHGRQRTRALYIAVNKNDDEIYTERVNYDQGAALSLIARAERVVSAATPPPCTCPPYFLRAGYGCAKFASAFARRNCRTCLHVTPRLDGDARWTCDRWDRDLTAQDQRDGCPRHLFIPALVSGDQIDCDPSAETVTYRLHNGQEWIDGVPGPRQEAAPRRANEFGLSADEIQGALT